MTPKFLQLVLLFPALPLSIANNWPQAAGPNGTWSVETDVPAPTSFNVAEGRNVLWTKTLEESGQSGIAVWDDRIFLSILQPFEEGGEDAKSVSTIKALCIDASTGETL